MIYINVARDFSETPGGRSIKDGDFSGEQFRKEILAPKYKKAIETNDKLQINLDGCFGYPSSFIDEAFGGLVKEMGTRDILKNIILICNDDPKVLRDIQKSVNDAVLGV